MSDLTLNVKVEASAVVDALWNSYESPRQLADFVNELFSQLPMKAQGWVGDHVAAELGKVLVWEQDVKPDGTD